MLTNLFVEKGDTKPDTDLIYMKKLNFALKKVLEWYFKDSQKILDVTTGEKRIWNQTTLHNNTLDTKTKRHDVTFLDSSPLSSADILGDFTQLPFADDTFDLIVFDPPFLKPTSGIEAFGIKKHRTPDRMFYFRQNKEEWVPPEIRFQQTWKEFNRVSKNGLIVKISERYENGYEIPVTTHMDLAYDNRFNSESQFKRCAKIGYRGKRAGLGAKMIHAQRVLSYYAVYKKDYKVK